MRNNETDRISIAGQRLAIDAVREQDFVVPEGRVQLNQREYHLITVTRLRDNVARQGLAAELAAPSEPPPFQNLVQSDFLVLFGGAVAAHLDRSPGHGANLFERWLELRGNVVCDLERDAGRRWLSRRANHKQQKKRPSESAGPGRWVVHKR